ncbi:flagellar protein export ATPase FliI [Shewanella sp. D64]|uniref:flagellar protein export ATPase FliI n=1 Tax=unclassified Shewanella TaxID=196818 RepID=UPI0022BA2815|nr:MULTISPECIES: flagellar protein export ATPase FliI [unclassified Shewanella]MEC4725914.1 flagellar protein export ATPase FliI [Shewanella sp. D64]MEC4737169.1 flagellar protein export ATPase FliI [Shewanella sp. E94]WBJ95639.1 flagellar protein export ATPase FliI [Shewanella sp. MTB7]
MQNSAESIEASIYENLDWPQVPVAQVYGRLTRVNGMLLEAIGCQLGMGDRCHIECRDGRKIEAEVVGFHKETLCLMPMEHTSGLMPGARVMPLIGQVQIPVGNGLLGRVLDGLAQPLDTLGPLSNIHWQPLTNQTTNPLLRKPITEPLDVGIRAINALLPIGRGQRLGLFAGSGVGKSVLLGMMTRFTEADVVIVGLIGERGREVREFIEQSLGEEGLKRAVVIAAPADTTPLMRMRAMRLCHHVATAFRDQGKQVLLLVDSLTRYAQAQREIALSLGEPPATKGYPPSAFAQLPSLVEQAGNGQHPEGTLTAFYTVLTEGDDQQDPIADAARAILDGHLVLSRQLAEQGHFPAIDIAASVSRLASQVADQEQIQQTQQFRHLNSRYNEVRELLPLGGYQAGHDPQMDLAVDSYPMMASFLKQETSQKFDLHHSLEALNKLTQHFANPHPQRELR